MSQSNVTVFILAAALMIAVFTLGNVYAQNGTSTDEASLGGQTAITMGLVGTIILTILGIVKQLADKGWFDKKVGSAAVMGADAAVAVLQTRELVAESVNAIIETIKIDSPELAKKIGDNLSPILKKIDEKVTEYQPKVNAFGQIANKIGDKGDKTVDAIKEDEELKDNIPDTIIPS